jgi:hypothetical protein
MNPMLIAALASFGPALLSKLFGGKSPQEQAMEKIRALYDPAYRAKLQAQYYQQNLQSPAYSQAQGTIAAGANQAASTIASNLGQTGLTPSGTGAIMSGMVPSMVGHNLAGLRTTAYNAGGQAADTSIEGMVRALLQTAGPSQTSQLFAGGMDAFGPMLTAWLKSKYPQLGTQTGGLGSGMNNLLNPAMR